MFYVNQQGEASATLIMYEVREGDLHITIEQDGFSEDVQPLIYGYLNCCYPNERTRTGLIWDEARILTFIGGDTLLPSVAWHLTAAGFTIPEGYL